jgi:hypothetical protein
MERRTMMKVLIACEFSGVVRRAFRDRGHDAWSCDILPSEDDSPYHIQDDVIYHLEGWDMIIAHPPCTYLCVPGAHYLHSRPERWQLMLAGKAFFEMFLNLPATLKVAVENSLPHRYARLPRYSQIIQPWMFGHEVSKRTCLWLRNLPHLQPTDIKSNHGDRYIRTDRQIQIGYGKTSNSKWYATSNQKERSRTFKGIAEAMATQWGKENDDV